VDEEGVALVRGELVCVGFFGWEGGGRERRWSFAVEEEGFVQNNIAVCSKQ